MFFFSFLFEQICKDKAETEVWFAALKFLIEKSRNRRARSEIPEVCFLHNFYTLCYISYM